MKPARVIILLVLPSLHADWGQTNGPYGGYVSSLAVSPNGSGGMNLYAGTSAGVFRSTDNGTHCGEPVEVKQPREMAESVCISNITVLDFVITVL